MQKVGIHGKPLPQFYKMSTNTDRTTDGDKQADAKNDIVDWWK